MSTPTPRQRACLEFIRAYQEEHGFGPSYREIADQMGLKSKSDVCRIVRALEARGLLRKPARQSRCYDLSGESGAAHHLRAILHEIRKTGHIMARDPAVVSAMRFARPAT